MCALVGLNCSNSNVMHGIEYVKIHKLINTIWNIEELTQQ
jgi:hypothetical protein